MTNRQEQPRWRDGYFGPERAADSTSEVKTVRVTAYYLNALEAEVAALRQRAEEAEGREREADAETRFFAGRNATLLDENQQLAHRLAAAEAQVRALEPYKALC